MNLANLFEVDWSLCTDARAKANDHWWRALKHFEFVAKSNPTGSRLEWRKSEERIPSDLIGRAAFRRQLEELAAFRFEAVRRVLRLKSWELKWHTLDFDIRQRLIHKLGKGYNPPCLFLSDDPGIPESAVQLASGRELLWDLALPDDVLIRNFRELFEVERIRFGICPSRDARSTKGMTTSPPQWHLLELLDERLDSADTHRRVGRPSARSGRPPNAYSTEEYRKVKTLIKDALKWAESCYCSL